MEEVDRVSRAKTLELLGKLAGEIPVELETLFDYVVGGMSSEEISSVSSNLIARATFELHSAIDAYDLDSKIGVGVGRCRTLGDVSVEEAEVAVGDTGDLEGSTCFIAIVTPDMKYLVDTFTEVMREHGVSATFSIHPMVPTSLIEIVGKSEPLSDQTSLFYAEFEQIATSEDLEGLAESFRKAYQQLIFLHSDLQEMFLELNRRAKPLVGEHLGSELSYDALGLGNFLPVSTRVQSSHGVRWLGCKVHELDVADLEGFLDKVNATYERGESRLFAGVANVSSPVVRRTRLRVIEFLDSALGIRSTFFGVFIPPRLSHAVSRLPFLLEKVNYATSSLSLSETSYAYRSALDFIQLLAPDEILAISKDELRDLVAVALSVEEIPRLKMVVFSNQRDSHLVQLRLDLVLPASRYSEHLTDDLSSRLEQYFGPGSIELSLSVVEGLRCFMSFVVDASVQVLGDETFGRLEDELDLISMSWGERFKLALANTVGETKALSLFQSYWKSFESSYHDDNGPEQGARDVVHFDELRRSSLALDIELDYREQLDTDLRMRIFKIGPWMALSEILPVVEHFGFTVINELPYRFNFGEDSGWLLDLGIEVRDQRGVHGPIGVDDLLRAKVAMLEIWSGLGEDDELNALVVSASLNYREVSLLRAYAHYLRFSNLGFSASYIKYALKSNPQIAKILIRQFYARFGVVNVEDLSVQVNGSDYVMALQERLAVVESLDFDKMFRALSALIEATVRTNFFLPATPAGVALKFDPSSLGYLLPQPLPKHEFYYLSKSTEAVHLRGGDVARGGIRWSDRLEDFRIEVLGLMKAQSVKNSVIVPVGAKGGFVVRGDGVKESSKVVESYREFISALFDLTDNIVDSKVVHPADVPVLDGEDAYLVVAADKGTATFSDIANEIAIKRRFWLGDAFASGGSEGYDHKKMAITAKGAWMSVCHHFGELGVDPEKDSITVVGIGDMSGDVFGNGMLLSESMRLVAAFDHRDIFFDPNPDVEAALKERKRLFDLERSSWQDYDKAKISKGGGVFSRRLKTVDVSVQVAQVLGIDPGSYEPTQVIKAILRAPVDLLWNGGVGTYVKASTETHDEVSDRNNDPVRVNARELQAKVVGEGGNLGFTQKGRIEYSLVGGRCNTDAIDNSAGVDTSDHEVNLKILLASAIEVGRIDVSERTPLLFSATSQVKAQVLEDNVYQNWVLSASQEQARSKMNAISRLTERLIDEAELDPEVEFLPTPKRVLEIASKGGTITRPELSVLLAYAKLDLYHHILNSPLVSDEFSTSLYLEYFPELISSKLTSKTLYHPLKREIIATVAANRLVNLIGITSVFELSEISSVSVEEASKALMAALEILDAQGWVKRLVDQVQVPQKLRVSLMNRLALSSFRMARWLITSGQINQSLSDVIGRFEPAFPDIFDNLSFVLDKAGFDRQQRRTSELVDAGLDKDVATFFGVIDTLVSVPAVVMLEEEFNLGSPTKAARIFFAVGTLSNLPTLRSHLSSVQVGNHWEESSRELLFVDLSYIQMELARSATKYLEAHIDESEASMDPLALWGLRHREHLEKIKSALRSLEDGEEVVSLAQLYVTIREVALLVRSIEHKENDLVS